MGNSKFYTKPRLHSFATPETQSNEAMRLQRYFVLKYSLFLICLLLNNVLIIHVYISVLGHRAPPPPIELSAIDPAPHFLFFVIS